MQTKISRDWQFFSTAIHRVLVSDGMSASCELWIISFHELLCLTFIISVYVRFSRPTRYIQDFWWSQAETEISATAIKKSHRNLRCISSQTPSTRRSLPSEEKNFPYLAPGTSSVSYLLPFPPTPQLKNQKTSYWVRRIVIKARKFQTKGLD